MAQAGGLRPGMGSQPLGSLQQAKLFLSRPFVSLTQARRIAKERYLASLFSPCLVLSFAFSASLREAKLFLSRPFVSLTQDAKIAKGYWLLVFAVLHLCRRLLISAFLLRLFYTLQSFRELHFKPKPFWPIITSTF